MRQAEMISMPLIHQPFQRIAMDVVGPLPRSWSGNKYILIIYDYARKYQEAIALPSTKSSQIAKDLVSLFSRAGIPKEILTNQGSTSYLESAESRLRLSSSNGWAGGMAPSRNKKDWYEYPP